MSLRTNIFLRIALTGALCLGLGFAAQASQNVWDQIDLDGPIETVLPDGTARTLEPSCSGGPELTAAGPVPADTRYYFFVQKGDPNKLLIALDGGGACWDAATCIGSPLTGSSTYTVALDETPGRLAAGGGLFDASNPRNPFQNYTKVFIPYCTGDVHWGGQEKLYFLDLGAGGVIPWVIHHRGTDNVLAVLDWLEKNGRDEYQVDLGRARDVTVTGASAGGYGADVAFAYVAELTPRARHNLISDAAIGVLTDDFYRTAIYDPANPGFESWGVQANLPSWVPGFSTLLADAAAAPGALVPLTLASLAEYKPAAHMASLTSNFDLVQIFFYGLMKGVVPPDATTAAEWYFGMKASTGAAALLPNYRYFIENGEFHTFIGVDELVYEPGATGVVLADWIRAMIKPGNRTWENVDAGPPQ